MRLTYHLARTTADKFQYMVRASYIEIYNEEIRDLVSKDCPTSREP